jgi:hypothetical protein
MTRYRIGVKATAIRYYEVEADSLADALDTWTDGVYSHEADEVVGEDRPVFAEALDADRFWLALDLPPVAARD